MKNERGRPNLPEEEHHSERVAVYLTQDDKQLLTALSRIRRTRTGTVARDLISAALREDPALQGLAAQQSPQPGNRLRRRTP